MEKERLQYLLERHLDNKTSISEKQELAVLLEEDQYRTLVISLLEELRQREAPAYPADGEAWRDLVSAIISVDKSGRQMPAAPVRRMYLRVAIAAAVVLIAAGAGFYFLLKAPQKAAPGLAVTPVHSNTLILANQRQLYLDEMKNGLVAEQGGTGIIKNDSLLTYTSASSHTGIAFYNVVSTAKSSRYGIILPDGSHVWLNAASSIKFPVGFSSPVRMVELSGEAWFDVQHADKQPFLIRSGGISTAVLGTAFDVKAYPGGEAMTVSVQSGRVRIMAGDKTLATLEKGRQVRIAAGSVIGQSNIDTSLVAAWRQGILLYKDEQLEELMLDLQRVFNASVTIRRPALKKETVTVSLNKTTGLPGCLEVICRLVNGRLSGSNGIYTIE